jgi:putative ABC transport system permease protein
MGWITGVRARLGQLLRRRAAEERMDEEIRFHVEMETEKNVRSGMGPAEARRRALIAFGGMEGHREEMRSGRRVPLLEDLWQDARFAARSLYRSPAFAVVAVLTLALGIGANTAVFSVVNSALLRPPPYPDADRIVVLHELDGEGVAMPVTGGNFVDWREANRTFEAMAVHSNPESDPLMTILGGGAAVRTRVTGVSEGFFRVMGLGPALGRGFAPEETRPGAPRVMLVSHSFWRGPLGGDPEVLGRTLDWDGRRYEIVGVMPAGFGYPAGTDLWVAMERAGIVPGRMAHNYAAVGRLREGVSVEAARRDLDRITAALKQRHGGEMNAVAVRVARLQDALVGDLRRPLLLLFGASALVLLIACANLASTFLARGAGREREIAVRTSLGASRQRLIRQLLTESLVLSLLGVAVGLATGALLLRALVALGPAALAATGGIGLDGRVLGFALLTALATTLLFGLAPALRTSRGGPAGTLRSGAHGNAGGRRGGPWGALVGVEVALAILLLVGSGLLLRSFREVLGVDTGFDAARVLTVDISLPASRYAEDPEKAAFFQRLLGELERVAGVEAAGLIQHLPLGGISHAGSFEVEGRGSTHELGVYPGYRVASAGYFEAMRIPLLRGRLFGPGDHAGAGDVAVINRALAERVWPGEDPIGRRVRNFANDSWIYPDRWVTVVGVVGDVRHGGLLEESVPEVYVHYLQRPDRAQSSVVTLGTRVPPASVADAVRARLHALDPDVPVELATMSARMVESVADRRFTMLVLGAFALVALLLAAVGIYGVVSYAVARSTREIGIRLALGAQPGSVRGLVQRRAMRMTLGGVAAGVAAALLLSRVLQGLLYGVSPTDPATFTAVVATLVGVAWLASYIPARRVARIDPMITMRAE